MIRLRVEEIKDHYKWNGNPKYLASRIEELIGYLEQTLEGIEDVLDYFSADYYDGESETAKMIKRLKVLVSKGEEE